MSASPLAAGSGDSANLSQRYRKLLQDYDAAAVRNKSRLLWLWSLSMVLAWVPLLLAITALSWPLPDWLNSMLLRGVLPAAGFADAVVTVTQFVLIFRGRWLRYRAATERLREHGMRFLTRLQPYHQPDAETAFANALDEMEEKLRERQPLRRWLWDQIPWSYLLGLKPLPEKLAKEFRHAPDEGLHPRPDNDLVAAEILILHHRLRNQQRWHLVKARSYSRRYLALQLLMVLLGLANAAYGWLVGLEFGVPALISTATLCVVAYRENLGYASLCLRYARIVETLERIEAEYLELKGCPGATTAMQREWLRDAAFKVERALASEFQYWYFGRENFGATSA